MILWRNIKIYHFDSDNFYYMLGANLGSVLYGDVSVMHKANAMNAPDGCQKKLLETAFFDCKLLTSSNNLQSKVLSQVFDPL